MIASSKKTFTLAIIIIIVIIIIVVTSIAAFGKNKDKIFQNTTIDIEKNVYKLNTLAITYNEFKQNTDKYLSNYFPSFYNQSMYAQDGFVYAITGKHYSEKDWAGLSMDELKKVGEPLYKSLLINVAGLNYSSFEVSKVFDDNSGSQHFKYVFVKYTINFDNVTRPLYKKYTFIKVDNKYVLFSIEGITLNNLNKNKELQYANENVKFEKKVNLKQ